MDAHAALMVTATLRYATLPCTSVGAWIGVDLVLEGSRFRSQCCYSPLKGLLWQGALGAAIGGVPPAWIWPPPRAGETRAALPLGFRDNPDPQKGVQKRSAPGCLCTTLV